MSLERATVAAAELLRVALLAKLACDLGDPQLTRRAARHAQTVAHHLAGLHFPVHPDYVLPEVPDALPEVDDLLELLHPRPAT